MEGNMHQRAKRKLDVMKHALGWPKCYRNHFCAGPKDQEIWDELVEEGCAVKLDIDWAVGPVYEVTPAGRAVVHSAENYIGEDE